MKISSRTLDSHLIFDLEGNIAFEETQEMENFINTGLEGEYQSVAINLKNVPYLNSSALGSLVRILQTVKGDGKNMFILNANRDIMNLFTITGVNRYFKFLDGEDKLAQQ
jgi:anti-sigma B factor antagonist